MSIDDIKDINKLRNMLKEAYKDIDYLKKCCRKVGEELAKYTFEYDEKPKNLVVQAKTLNSLHENNLKYFDKKLNSLGIIKALDTNLIYIQFFNQVKDICKDYNSENSFDKLDEIDTIVQYCINNYNMGYNNEID